MRALLVFAFTLFMFTSCDQYLDKEYKKRQDQANDAKLNEYYELQEIRKNTPLERIPDELALEIIASLEIVGSPFSKPPNDITEVNWDEVSLSGYHTRRAAYKNYFFFPYWNIASHATTEPKGWNKGLAVKKGETLLYSWKIE